MAKGGQLVDLIEQHIEKAVLGICLLLLGGAMIHWVASSPRTMEMPADRGSRTKSVLPDNVDAELLKFAKTVQRRNDDAPHEVQELPDYAAEIRKLQDQPVQKKLALFVELAYPMAELDIGPNVPALQKFAVADFESGLSPTSRPEVKIAQELIRKPDENVDVIAAHVVAEFDYGQLQQQWDQKLQNTALPGHIIFLGVEAEVQARRFDGTWGPSRTVSMVRHDEDRGGRGRYGQIPGIPSYDGRNARDIETVVGELERYWQEHILQPGYWDIMGRSEWVGWRMHLPETSVTALAKDPNRTTKTRRERQPTRSTRREIGRRPLGRDYSLQSGMDALRRPPPDMRPMDMHMRPSARRLSPRASRRPQDRTRPPKVEPEKPELLEPQETPVLPFDEQIAEGTVLVWFHDISLASMKEYRYRVRLILVSPLLARDGYVKDPNDARVVAIVTPFSQWSTPTRAPRDTEMFLTGSSGGPSETPMVVVNVFARHLGQSIKRSFPVKHGDPIGKRTMVQFIDRNSRTEKSAEIDFSTGAIAVDFDFKKVVPKGLIFKETVEMLYLDETGQLRSTVTIHDMDRTTQEYERFKSLQMELTVSENSGMLR